MSSSRTFRVGLVQMAMTPEPQANLSAALDGVREAAAGGANVICLPELFRSQYFCQVEDAELFDLAEEIPGPTSEALSEVAREQGVVVVGSLFEKRAPGLYHNSAVILGPGGEQLGVYRKMHIPDDPAYYEKFYFTPGEGRPLVVQTPFGRVGVLVCWDQWFPEAARMAALQGAEVLFYPTAIGWHPAEKDQVGAAQRDAWRTIQRSHAIASGMYVAAVNRTGHETPAGGDGIEFWGSTFLAGPFGQMVAEAPVDRSQVLVADVDTGEIERTRRGWPFLRDRRIDAYHPLLKRWDDKTDT